MVSPCGKGGDDRGCLDFTTFPVDEHPNSWSIAGYEFGISEWDGSAAHREFC